MHCLHVVPADDRQGRGGPGTVHSYYVVAGNEPPGSFGRATGAFTAESWPVPRGADYDLLPASENFYSLRAVPFHNYRTTM